MVCRMAVSDSSECVNVCGSEQKADTYRARSSVENTGARDEGVPEPTELQSRNRFHSRALHLTAWDWQQLFEVEQRAKDRYDLVDGTLRSRVGMAGDNDFTRPGSALFRAEEQSAD